MIKTLIKHQLTEYAIAVFFDNLIDGFCSPELKRKRRKLYSPELIPIDEVEVIPLSEPIGLRFALRYLYGKNSSETFSL